MPVYQRFIWGLLAGIAVICVKIIGPDKIVVKEYIFLGNSGEITFYIFLSFVTIFLGGISGLFSKSTEPAQILVFCAAFPALVTTAFNPERMPQNSSTSETAAYDIPSPTLSGIFNFVAAASAQPVAQDVQLVCDEGDFLKQFGEAAKTYFSNQSEAEIFSVVVASEKNLDQAILLADEYARKIDKFEIQVGCRRPNNPYFPVIIGGTTDLLTASEIKGEIIGAGLAPRDTFISNYSYRKPVYQADRQ